MYDNIVPFALSWWHKIQHVPASAFEVKFYIVLAVHNQCSSFLEHDTSDHRASLTLTWRWAGQGI